MLLSIREDDLLDSPHLILEFPKERSVELLVELLLPLRLLKLFLLLSPSGAVLRGLPAAVRDGFGSAVEGRLKRMVAWGSVLASLVGERLGVDQIIWKRANELVREKNDERANERKGELSLPIRCSSNEGRSSAG